MNFQATKLLEVLVPDRQAVGGGGGGTSVFLQEKIECFYLSLCQKMFDHSTNACETMTTQGQ